MVFYFVFGGVSCTLESTLEYCRDDSREQAVRHKGGGIFIRENHLEMHLLFSLGKLVCLVFAQGNTVLLHKDAGNEKVRFV